MAGDPNLTAVSVLHLGPKPSSPRLAREFVRQVLGDRGIDSRTVDDAALVTTELVTNAVIHARTESVLEVEVEGDRILVSVSDSSLETPKLRHPAQTDTNGRGVRILDALAAHWDVALRPNGKTVRFYLPAVGMALQE